MFNFWWSVGLVNGLKPSPPPLSSQKNKIFIFGLRSTSDDRLGWSMDLNPVRDPSPVKKIKWSFLDYVQLLMIGRAGWWTWTPSATLSSQKIKCLFLDYVQLLMIGWAGRWTRTPSTTPLQPKNWNACFWITFNFWWSAGLVDGLKPPLPPLSSQKIKCPFLDYIQILMIGQAGQWTRTSSDTPLQPKKLNASFWITFNFWWSAMLVNGLKPRPPPLSSQKMKCSFLDYVQLLMIGHAGRWTRTLSVTPLQSKK